LIQRAEQSFAGSIEALLAEDAPSDLTRALELANDVDPTFEGRLALARTYAAGDRKREARGALARAEELAREPEQLHLLSFRWAEIGDGARSRRLLETLTRRFPELALYWSDLGVALYRSGDANGAERALRRALTAEPGMPAATLSLAALLSGRGAHDEARFLCASAKLSRLEDDDLRARLQACGAGRSD
jgi:Tfp pilus assembly protein PilF